MSCDTVQSQCMMMTHRSLFQLSTPKLNPCYPIKSWDDEQYFIFVWTAILYK